MPERRKRKTPPKANMSAFPPGEDRPAKREPGLDDETRVISGAEPNVHDGGET